MIMEAIETKAGVVPTIARSKITRRSFIKSTAFVGGTLVLGIGVPGLGRKNVAHAAMGGTEINAWLAVNADNTVTLRCSQSEMGQGTTMGNSMMFVEEFGCNWADVRHEYATGRPEYVNPLIGFQLTGGSTATPGFWDVMRKAGAQAREMFRMAAAKQWNVDVEKVSVANGKVMYKGPGVEGGGREKTATFAELAEAASKIEPPKEVTLKRPGEFKLIGRSVNRLDSEVKVTGKAVFGMDVVVPNMWVATIKQAPFGGKIVGYDEAAAKRVKGVHAITTVGQAVFPNNSQPAVVVAADTYWQAVQGMKAANVQFDRQGWEKLNSPMISKTLHDGAKEKGKLGRVEGDVDKALGAASKTLEAEYEVPYMSHAPLESMNCTANVTSDFCEVWAPTQGAGPGQIMASMITGLPMEKVKVHMTYLGGGFGRRTEVDYIEQTVETSMKLKHAVKLIWSREEDLQHSLNRPTYYAKMTAAIKGNDVTGLRHKVVGPGIWLSPYRSTRIKDLIAESDFMKGMRESGVDFHSVQGAKDIGYNFGNLEVAYVQRDFPVPVVFYRGVGNTQHAFFIESFVDELAHATKQDPLALRRKLLAKEPRMLAVLDLAAEKAGYGKKLPAGHFHGIAFHNSFESPFADVMEISVRGGRRVTIHKVTRAMDCGLIVNPDQVNAQFQSGLVWGLTMAMYSELTVDGGDIVQSNWHDYKVLKINQMPEFEAHVVKSEESPSGIGEPVFHTAAPALANAIFNATGKRLRSLPLSRHGMSLA
jgi:isoquinoline 1-oxidoreductase beta subunit